MKSKIFLYLSLFAGLAFTACNDDDITVNTTPILDEQSVVTGSADVTATTATLHGTVAGLENSSPSSYTVGFNYGTEEGNLNQDITGSIVDGVITAELTGLADGTTIYYQAFAKLQGRVTFTGDVKSIVTTDAVVTTKDAAEISDIVATLGGSVSGAPSGATFGIVIAPATVESEEDVRAGLIVPAADAADFAVSMKGLVPEASYKYAAYADLGAGVIYGEVKSFATAASTFDVDNDLVDLGLSVKWAKYNIGAHSEGELGGYFGFGDIHGVMNTTIISKYATADVYRTASDVAYNAYGGRATLPSADDFRELFNNCTKEWTSVDGVNGYRFTGPNGNSIFLPAAGSRTVNDITGEGIDGNYATGSIVGEGSKFAVAYNFSSSTSGKINAPVYQGLSARAVSTARNVPFVKEKVYGKWYMENGQDGKLHVWQGPFTQFGDTDNWKTVTNKEPNIYQQIYWEMGTDNGWIGYTYGEDYGYMELLEDGTVNIHRGVVGDDSKVASYVDETGHFTIDESDMTINIDVDVICGHTWLGTKQGKLKILELTDEGMRIALPSGDGYAYAVNYYNEEKRAADEAIVVNAIVSGAGASGVPVASIAPTQLAGKHTLKFEGACAGSGQVLTLDFVGLLERYPDALVTITDIRCDGQSIPFDAAKFYYGDLENNGNYRVQLANVWGMGNVDSKYDTPFSNLGLVDNDPAFSFTTDVEYDVYISTSSRVFTPFVGGMNEGWGGIWDAPADAQSFNIDIVGGKIVFDTPKAWSAELAATGFETGPRVLCVRIKGLYGLFPNMHCTLDGVAVDGRALTIADPSLALNGSADGGGVDYELTIYNQWNDNIKNYCSLGAPEGDLLKVAAFSDNVKVDFTIDNLFQAPQF